MKVYDCFLFYDELDLLEIRLNILNEFVDFFVIVEASISFQGNKKSFNFEQNHSRFQKFLDKIIYFKIPESILDFESLPYVKNPISNDQKALNQIFDQINKNHSFDKKKEYWWGNDFFQRECIRRALLLKTPDDSDLILLSDLDEIPNPKMILSVLNAREFNTLKCFKQLEFCYYLNYFHNAEWLGTCSFFYGTFKNHSLNAIRFALKRDEGLKPDVINDGGWHFTSIGSVSKIVNKVQNWGHREFNNAFYLWLIKYNVFHGNDIFRRKNFGKLTYLELSDHRFPEYLRCNSEKFIHLYGPRILDENLLQRLSVNAYFFIIRLFLRIVRKLK